VGSLPLPPQNAAQFTPKPTVQFLEETFRRCVSEVVQPPPQFRIRLRNDLAHASAFTSSTNFLQGCLQSCHHLTTHSQAGFVVPSHAVTQEGSLPWPINRAFGLVDREFEPLRQVTGYRGHNPFAAGFGGSVDVAIISKSAKGVTTAFQFVVEFVQKDV
jgi:hypothetical protein